MSLHVSNDGSNNFISISNNDIDKISITDSNIVVSAPQYSNNELNINWDFMGSRFWNLSEQAQDLIMDKLGVDSISN